ncbi:MULTISPECIES: sensor domain-containing diguanylate cyclase [Pseudomonas]|uniref:sensor domain-containing diguanylate cyclase n=1 Tax=Pseudomonas TaxID=286 RepID=UPI001C802D0D|nr:MULTISPECIES: sensor domain-containing diguanylate cyclase [Pseudomonas]MDG9931291.1 sensor domain-containing diguanylate cyclase [Pseudomonas sp. GD04042]MDH0485970.1 sensor domain-containing diguanylate cyclase [Pseudomonas sp. GD04015]MDH0606638.1 sensor domain-containing diguanylate cyclase [Pseudomonas sp. GD03869]MDH0897041.1 sensor domain-containing diguanylate cyclase [Pseudomonas sp. GD03875]MDH1066952.1 sensor domain-containing diguanylate cyclase [Pseudomonas sp. GD03985]
MDDNEQAPSELETLTLALLHSRGEVERLREREQLVGSLLAGLNAVLWAFDWEQQRMVYVSPAYEQIFGRSAALLLADYNEWLNSIYPDDMEYAARSLQSVLEVGSVEQREYRIIRGDGEVRWLSDKCFISPPSLFDGRSLIVGIAEDITEKKTLQGELHRLATSDVLTGASNRRHFFECAEALFAESCSSGRPLSFLLLDIDDFKKINDSHGHQAGDRVLQRVAHCAAYVLRRDDLFGRIGGEEFAAIFPNCDAQQARQVAERLQREVQRLQFSNDGETFGVTISQGITVRGEGDELDDLYARADAAMYQAKRQGKDCIVLG